MFNYVKIAYWIYIEIQLQIIVVLTYGLTGPHVDHQTVLVDQHQVCLDVCLDVHLDAHHPKACL